MDIPKRSQSTRGNDLVARLRAEAAGLIAVAERIGAERWRRVPAPGVWSIGKEVVHVADASTYHQWIVRRTIGQPVSASRPAIERAELTTDLSPDQAIALVRQRTDEAASLFSGLTDAQLELATKPARARGEVLAVTIERVLIGHYRVHREEIEALLR